jgi:cytoskeletal protein RodZ
MSLTLGEKLQQAREARGVTISEVAEQTRISRLYLECIENNDYRTLPGGIFNKGFVKSYARYVGVDEQEALQDYNSLIIEQQGNQLDEPKTYKPEVLTDERNSSSLITIIFAVVILVLMTFGILKLVNYLQTEQNPFSTGSSNTNTNANTNTAANNSNTNTNVPPAPTLETAKIEFKASGGDISLTATTDGKTSYPLVTAEKTVTFTPKESLKLSYAKSRAQFAQLTINGKQITLPTQPADARRVPIDVEINRSNIAQIWQSGQVSTGATNSTNTTAPR